MGYYIKPAGVVVFMVMFWLVVATVVSIDYLMGFILITVFTIIFTVIIVPSCIIIMTLTLLRILTVLERQNRIPMPESIRPSQLQQRIQQTDDYLAKTDDEAEPEGTDEIQKHFTNDK